MRFLIFSILIYFVAGQAALLKALDVFKKNQWSVNKVLKSNQLQAKQRADGLQRMIMAQSKIIQDLQVRNLWPRYLHQGSADRNRTVWSVPKQKKCWISDQIGPTVNSNLGLDQDHNNYENLGPIRTWSTRWFIFKKIPKNRTVSVSWLADFLLCSHLRIAHLRLATYEYGFTFPPTYDKVSKSSNFTF